MSWIAPVGPGAFCCVPAAPPSYGHLPAAPDSVVRWERTTPHRPMTTNRSGSRVIVPTVEDVLSDTAIGDGYHDFAVQGGTVRLTEAELRPALEAAYDATMPDWPVLVEID